MPTYIRTYSELMSIKSFLDRYEYCRIGNNVGLETFGGSRYLNQILYNLPNYKEWRNDMIMRDFGRDLGDADHPIAGKIIIHHLNPLTIDDVKERRPCCMDPENVICVSHQTHNAIHYGDSSLLMLDPIVRVPGDTCPWLK